MVSYSLKKIGKICFLSFRIDEITTTAAWSIIANIPDECHPLTAVRFACCASGGNETYLLAVSKNGLQIHSTVSGVNLWGYIVYMTK